MTPSIRFAMGSARAWAPLVYWTCVLLFVPVTLVAADVTVRGQVLLDGTPAADLAIAASTGKPGHATRTDDEGRFTFDAPMKAGLARLVVNLDDTTVHHEEITVGRDDDVLIDVVRGRLQGTVVDSRGGGPIADAEVTLTRVPGSAASRITSVHTRSAADGRFDLRPTAQGRYTMTVRRQGYGLDERALGLVRGKAVDGITVTLEPVTSADVTARATNGTTLRHLQVVAFDEENRTVVAGGSDQPPVRLDGVPAGTWRLLVLADGMAAFQAPWTVPGAVPTIELEPEARLAIEVPALTSGSDGTSTAATVSIRGSDGRSLLAPWASQHSETWPLLNGQRTIGHLPAGPLTVEVTASDDRTWRQEVTTQVGVTTRVVLE